MLLTKQQRQVTVARNIVIYDELTKVLPAFNQSGIKVIVLSGAALARTVYPDISLRPMSDIDLLIKSADLPEITVLLSHLGYTLETSRQDEAHFTKTNSRFTIHLDVHFNFTYLTRSDLSETWARGCKTNLAGMETTVLSSEDALIYTVLDALTSHGGLSQTALTDLVLESRQVNWSALVKLTKRYRLEAPMHYALSVIAADEKIPDEVLKAIKPYGRQLLSQSVLIHLTGLMRAGMDDLAPIIRLFICPGRVGFLVSSFLPPARFMVQRYQLPGKGLSYFYYPARVLSHFWRVIKIIGSQLFSRV